MYKSHDFFIKKAVLMDMYTYPDMCETLFLTLKTSSLLEETKPNTDISLN